ncbi:phage tail protein [Salmonella enterica]|uniref:Phage tail protein n=1 Tax=Salmonella newport TaxID=108619 RepID=A0A3X9ZSU4_SALNE|nr:phage tail protein [Salmonella enterica subsp. enterica serovar Newport]EAN8606676.1 phage tail protein [Salmonella enterica]EBW1603657.1 phage tail protein [Salmonella enterica subsp. enterica serovar Kottbus]EBW8792561.1 phage tail protein [Salmonella enterica subsp. enterica serovar Oranienburg]ECA9706341.1 phage tail protein [Salmonella enterica subsp. enterica serovar Bredeney]ECD2011033.1 phage tail protein [Salmonella enterica subsp. enterica serovar Give]ECF2942098.1 phage tail pro
MADTYVGPVVLEVNGTEIEVTRVSPSMDTGRKLVKTMNSTGRARGHVNGIATYNLTLEAVKPKGRTIVWDNIVDAKLTLYPLEGGDKTITYQNFTVQTVGDEYSVDNEARVSITGFALNRVEA